VNLFLFLHRIVTRRCLVATSKLDPDLELAVALSLGERNSEDTPDEQVRTRKKQRKSRNGLPAASLQQRRRAFELLDKQGRGFINHHDICQAIYSKYATQDLCYVLRKGFISFCVFLPSSNNSQPLHQPLKRLRTSATGVFKVDLGLITWCVDQAAVQYNLAISAELASKMVDLASSQGRITFQDFNLLFDSV
jgi:hypothetical protein